MQKAQLSVTRTEIRRRVGALMPVPSLARVEVDSLNPYPQAVGIAGIPTRRKTSQTVLSDRASQRPGVPGAISNSTDVADVDGPRPVGNRRAVKAVLGPVLGPHRPEPGVLVEGDHLAASGQWMILDSGNSMMSVAPWSFNAGISVLISFLGTTVSTA